ncbi:class E sortase [Bifidobacterium sp. 82T10]|uniref:Class E sortase n=1 Tax=Bifidobacterium miconis TaxID=2834435 RepID=A0ABS6WHW9_9BIFI|nr:class E sortase [Bifidobacterium miconis]
MSRRERRLAARGGRGRAGGAGQVGNGRSGQQPRKHGWLWVAAGVLAEILLTMAAICALYIVWQMWWTGVQAEHVQAEARQSANWSTPGNGDSTKVAAAQQGDPPTEAAPTADGELMATVYIPRFGDNWERNLVQGTTLEQLNKHGLGHYTNTQMPGEVGNFAIAGHRNGYGQPLGDVDKLQKGDAIVIRTQNYWYVYEYTDYEIVLPTEIRVIGENPKNPGATPTERMITMTTCEPKYSDPIYRWISYGKLKYWAKVSDGTPKELATSNATGGTTFTVNEVTTSPVAKLDSLVPVIQFAVVAYVILFLAALLAWRYPFWRAVRAGERRRPEFSLYGGLERVQPGVLPIRLLLTLILLFVAAAALFQWGFPWAASHIPYLQQMSNFTV